jgi:hypothetical protein
MEMAMEVKDELSVAVERLAAAAGVLEMAAERLTGVQVSAAGTRESELEERLREAEATIASLRAEAGRKTLPAGVVSLVAKHGESADGAGLDAALVGLSPEQRIAVKVQLMRAGLVG